MSLWDDRLANHESQTVLARLSELLDAADAATTDELPSVERARKVVRTILAITAEIDSELVSGAMLARLGEHATASLTAAEAYVGSPSAASLDALHAQLDALLDAFEPMATAAPIVAPEQMREAATAYRRSAGQLLRSLEEDIRRLSPELAKLKSDFESLGAAREKSEADTAAELEQLRSAIDSQETRVTAALTGFQQQFSDAEARRQQTWTEFQTEAREAYSHLNTELSIDAEAGRTALEQSAAATIQKLEEYRDQAARLVNAVGANAFAGGYGVHANEEKKVADRWRFWAVLAMLAVGGLGVFYLFSVGEAEFSWQGFWIRAVIILPLAFIAAYAAAQSGRHRRNEGRSRQLALELLAIDPYLELLPPEKRDDVKIRLADRFFGNVSVADGDDDRMGVDKVLDAATKAAKRDK